VLVNSCLPAAQTCEEFITTLLRQMGDRVTVADSGGSASSAARDGQAQTVTLSDQMRKMEFGTWLEMMLQLFGCVLCPLKS
jgi:DNA-binding response OmpR family regulator